MDEADRAQAESDTYLKICLAKATGAGKTASESSIYCEDCGEEIPELRRFKMPGCIRCVECQTEFERIRGK